MYFLSSLRGQTAKTLICTKSGVSADSRKSAKKYRKVRRTALFAHFLYTFCAKSAVLRTFRYFLALFLESAETPHFVQINVFAVWPLRLDRKYTTLALKTWGFSKKVGRVSKTQKRIYKTPAPGHPLPKLGKSNGGFSEGGFSKNRFVLQPGVTIASEVSILSNHSLAITDFHAKKTQHVQLSKKLVRQLLFFGLFFGATSS